MWTQRKWNNIDTVWKPKLVLKRENNTRAYRRMSNTRKCYVEMKMMEIKYYGILVYILWLPIDEEFKRGHR